MHDDNPELAPCWNIAGALEHAGPVVNCSRQLAEWADTLAASQQRVVRVHVYANNHCVGCAYQTAAQLSLLLLECC